MQKEIKELLKDELKAVSKSRTSILIGLALVALDITLVLTSIFSVYSLIFIFPLILVTRKQINEYRVNQMMLTFTRYIIDEEFAKTLNPKENGK